MSSTNAVHGTTWFICSRISPLRVFLTPRLRPRAVCFMGWIFLSGAYIKHTYEKVLQSVLSAVVAA